MKNDNLGNFYGGYASALCLIALGSALLMFTGSEKKEDAPPKIIELDSCEYIKSYS